ncbi:MAG: tRNA (adenosine(37)-N6)-threonylcarbamoyltransferase complex dimerization subunit type 1 TsaB [Castellaniella sp.]
MDQYFLAIETSTHVCDVALLSCGAGGNRLTLAAHDGVAGHAEHVLGLVDQVLAQAQVDRHALTAIAFGQGPGGFTGLRLACGVAQGIAFGLALPVIGLSSLLALAAAAHHGREAGGRAGDVYICMQDARMDEIYLAVYQVPVVAGAPWQTLQTPVLIDAGQAFEWLQPRLADWGRTAGSSLVCCGDALRVHSALAQALQAAEGVVLHAQERPEAAAIAHLACAAHARGEGRDPEAAMPLYVRDKVAYTTAERARGAGGNPRVAQSRAPAAAATSSPAPEIVPMLENHLDAVADIEGRVQAFPWTRRNFADGLRAGYPAWVVRLGDVVAGFCMALLAPDVAHLLVIGVDPHHQGRGIGRRLLEHCEDVARKRGLDIMVLEVRPSNRKAMGFYHHLGFTAFSERKDYYPAPHGRREHACVMQKRLDAGGEAP